MLGGLSMPSSATNSLLGWNDVGTNRVCCSGLNFGSIVYLRSVCLGIEVLF